MNIAITSEDLIYNDVKSYHKWPIVPHHDKLSLKEFRSGIAGY